MGAGAINMNAISRSLEKWQSERGAHLDELEAAHAAVSVGGNPGAATQQLSFAYAMMVSSQFQGFCRDLHTEVALHLFALADSKHAHLADIVRARLLEGRKLDQGNPNPGNIGSDFGRFGVDYWALVEARGSRSHTAKLAIEDLAVWRNAIAHNDFTAAKLGGKQTLTLEDVRAWRNHANRLAIDFDSVLRDLLLDWWRPAAWDWR